MHVATPSCRHGDHRAGKAPTVGVEDLRRQLAAAIGAPRPGAGLGPTTTARRPRLHEIDPVYHCSMVGTCFGLGELRRLLGKLGSLRPGATDHEVHHDGVLVAARRDQAGKLMSKALDKKFRATVNRFAAARDADALGALWDEAVDRGDVPDAYWAVMTHPAATAGLVRRVFGEVHMLSHLVGAANRADIRRLQLLERERDDLQARLDRQQRHLTETLGAKERRIRELEALLAGRVGPEDTGETEAALGDALRREAMRRARLERRVETLEARLATAGRTARVRGEPPEEAPIGAAPASPALPDPGRPHLPELGGATLLVVGGRPGQVPPLGRAVAGAGGHLLHHDGGLEMSLALLPGLVGRADLVLLALDQVSHAAAAAARRLAHDGGKPLVPLRSLSLAALIAAAGPSPSAVAAE